MLVLLHTYTDKVVRQETICNMFIYKCVLRNSLQAQRRLIVVRELLSKVKVCEHKTPLHVMLVFSRYVCAIYVHYCVIFFNYNKIKFSF